MVRGYAVPACLARLATGQWGLLTTAQAEQEGVTRLQLARLADAGVLERIDRGVYAMTAAADEHKALRAAWLVLDPSRTAEQRLSDPIAAGVVSHASAAGLHGLGGLLDDVAEFTLADRKQSRRSVRLHRADLEAEDVTLVDGLPVTAVERTIADLVIDGNDLEHVAEIVGQAIGRGQLDLDVLAAQLDRAARRHGHADGQSFVEALLDMAGLSPGELMTSVAATPVGRELFTAGARAAMREVFATAIPQIDVSGVLSGLDAERFVTSREVAESLENVGSAGLTAEKRELLASLSAPVMAELMSHHRLALERAAELICSGYAQGSVDGPTNVSPTNQQGTPQQGTTRQGTTQQGKLNSDEPA